MQTSRRAVKLSVQAQRKLSATVRRALGRGQSQGPPAPKGGLEPASEPATAGFETAHEYDFACIPGYFVDYVQVANDSGGKASTQSQLGLLCRAYDEESSKGSDLETDMSQWTKFATFVDKLNRESRDGESYKLVYLLRHGTSIHNIIMEKVGSKAWKDYWAHEDGTGEPEGVTWVDAPLVEEGELQAKRLAKLWDPETESAGIPFPGSIYSSPLHRCLETTKLVYGAHLTQHNRPRPIVKELLRERLTNHTCDRRHPRSWIQERYPDYVIEEGFEEQDILWNKDLFETSEQHAARARRLLEDIFANDDSTFISLSLHSYAVSAVLTAVQSPKFRIGEGVIVPLFIKATRLSSRATENA
ncbi:putative phosphoglycerate mutase [Xylariales sp. PMI_506]|nr:putative phosphoglycerate mutase [Xylariales sp. PMI_506]